MHHHGLPVGDLQPDQAEIIADFQGFDPDLVIPPVPAYEVCFFLYGCVGKQFIIRVAAKPGNGRKRRKEADADAAEAEGKFIDQGKIERRHMIYGQMGSEAGLMDPVGHKDADGISQGYGRHKGERAENAIAQCPAPEADENEG